MKNPLISIIVPIYKVEKLLTKCVDSLLAQTYQNLEIILVDDGSPDACPQMCDEFAKQDSRIKVLHKQNGGLMAAWIDGVKMSSGEFVAFVDSDDWVEPSFIEDLYHPYTQIKDLGLSICKYYRASDSKKLEQNATKDNLVGLLEGDSFENYKNKYIEKFPHYRWNKLFKRESIISNLKYCDTRINMWEDVCMSVACILDSKKIFIVDKYLYDYYDRPSSMVNVYKENMLQNFEYFYPKFIEVLNDKKYATNENIIDHITRILYIVSKNIILSNAKEKKKIFNNLYNSWLYEEAKKYDSSTLAGVNKIFMKLFKTKSYFLTSTMIKLWNLIKN